MIQWNADLSRRLGCPSEEKAGLVPLIKRFVELSSICRTEGLAALESQARSIADPLFTAGTRLIAEGISGETLEDILSTYLAVSPASGFDFLKSCVMAEGLTSLSNGDDPALLLRKLSAYFGAEAAMPLLEELESAQGSAKDAQ